MTGDPFPPDPLRPGSPPPDGPPPRPAHVGPSRATIIVLGVLIVVFVFGLAAIVGYLVLGRGDSGGSFPTAADTVTVTATAPAPATSSTPTSTTRSRSSAPSSVPVTTAAGAPEDSRPCPILSGPTGLYRASSVGSSVTSCGFAEQVRLAYAASGRPGQLPRTISATSPETGQRIEMMCAAQGPIVTCNGGDDALVYLY